MDDTESTPIVGTVGERVRLARSERGLTTREVAAALNVSAPLISRWERDLVYPRLDEALDLCRALDISIGWLIEGVGATPLSDVVGREPGGFRTGSR